MDLACSRLRDSVLIWTVCVFLSQNFLVGQDRENVYLTRISINEGLSQAAVKAIFQDKQGFIWVGTEEGLNRYDGNGFLNFYHEPEEPDTLPHNWVSCLIEDDQNNLWIGTRGGGIARYDEVGERFITYRNEPGNPKTLSSDDIRVMFKDDHGTIWVGTNSGGLNAFNPSSGTVTRYLHNPEDENSLSSNRVRAVVADETGTLWVGTDRGGLNQFHSAEQNFTRYQADPGNPEGLPSNRIRTLYADGEDLWIGAYNNHLTKMNRETGLCRSWRHNPDNPFSLGPGGVMDILRDRRGVLWVGMNVGGLNRMRPDGESFDHYRHNPGDRHSLSDNRLFCLYQDRSGVLWVGTYGGLHSWNAQIGTFSHYKPNPLSEDALLGSEVTAFAESEQAIWVGVRDGGLSRLDRETGFFRQYPQRTVEGGGLSGSHVTALAMEGETRLWVGTLNGLDQFSPKDEQFTHFQHNPTQPESLSHNHVVGLSLDDDGQLWVACAVGGLNLFNRETRGFEHFPNAPQEETERYRATGFFAESSGMLLLPTQSGLQRFNPDTGVYDLYKNDPNNPTSLSSNQILSFCETRDSALWLGTQGGGLNRWEEVNRRDGVSAFTHFSRRDGLPSNNIFGVLEDENGNLWLSGDKGLARFNYETGAVTRFEAYRGLQDLEFIPGATMKDGEGRLYFGGVNGFNVFLPHNMRENTFVPPLALLSYYSNTYRQKFTKPLSEVTEIEVDYRQHVITMNFAGLEFTHPQANRYMHQLEGYDSNWMDLGNLNQVTYTNLPADSYVFRVKAANHDGVWNEGLSIQLKVESPPWKSPWAYLFYSIVVFLLWGLWLRLQTRKLTLEVERRDQLQQQVRARTRELEQQHYTLEKLNSKLEESSLVDQLTGLKNRRYMVHFVQENLFHFEANDFHEGGVDPEWMFMVVNLDRFRVLNDRFGHATGDMILVQARRILDDIRGESDLLIRWDSDEFMLLVRSPDPLSAKEIAERVRQSIELHTFTLGNGKSARLTCSIGFAFYPFSPKKPGKMNWHQVMMVADRALYLAKRNGYNAWAGILCGDYTISDHFIERLKSSPDKLAAEGAFELLTSLPKDRKLKWN